MNNERNVEPTIGNRYSTLLYGLDVGVLGVLCPVGCVANLLAIAIIRLQKQQSSMLLYLMFLAVLDLCFLIYVAVSMMLPAALALCGKLDAYKHFLIELDVIRWLWPLGCMIQTASILVVVMVTVDRYLAVCHPFRVASWMSVNHVWKILLGIAVFSIAIHIPRFFHDHAISKDREEVEAWVEVSSHNRFQRSAPENVSEDRTLAQYEYEYNLDITMQISMTLGPAPTFLPQNMHHFQNVLSVDDLKLISSGIGVGPISHPDLFPNNGTKKTHDILGDDLYFQYTYYLTFTFLVVYFLPLGILVILNTFLIQGLRNAKKQHEELIAVKGKSSIESRAATANIIAIVTVFIVCQSPDFAMVIVGYRHLGVNNNVIDTFSGISMCFLALNSTVNFFIYCLFMKKFRQTAARIFCCSALQKLRMNTSTASEPSTSVQSTKL